MTRRPGLTSKEQLAAAWRGDLMVPWRVIQRGRARALVEMDRGGDDGCLEGEGDVALHRALCALDPNGEVLGGTPLAARRGFKKLESTSTSSSRKHARGEVAGRGSGAGGGEGDEGDEVEADGFDNLNEDQLSAFHRMAGGCTRAFAFQSPTVRPRCCSNTLNSLIVTQLLFQVYEV